MVGEEEKSCKSSSREVCVVLRFRPSLFLATKSFKWRSQYLEQDSIFEDNKAHRIFRSQRYQRFQSSLAMGRRDNQISKSILSAIFHDQVNDGRRTVIGCIFAFFTFFRIILARYKDNLFYRLRNEEWEIDEDEYRESFRSNGKEEKLKAVGDLGYSGSVCLNNPPFSIANYWQAVI